MLEELTSEELTEWIEYYRLNPFGAERDDLRSALAASAICNTWGAKTKPADFIPDFEERRKPTLVEYLLKSGLPVKIKQKE